MRKVVAFILTAAMAMCVLTACSKIRYATDYPITVGEQKTGINGNWSVKKIVKDNILYLAVNRNGSDKDPLNYIGIWVYDSSKDARRVYNKQYSFSKDFGDKDAWQEGGNWFIGAALQYISDIRHQRCTVLKRMSLYPLLLTSLMST